MSVIGFLDYAGLSGNSRRVADYAYMTLAKVCSNELRIDLFSAVELVNKSQKAKLSHDVSFREDVDLEELLKSCYNIPSLKGLCTKYVHSQYKDVLPTVEFAG